MIKIYDQKNLPVKWCLQRIFKDVDLTFIHCEYPEPVFYDQPGLYYGCGDESYIETFEEYIPIPFHLYMIIRFVCKEKKRMGEKKYLLKPLCKELYDKIRKMYPHRRKETWEVEVIYEEILGCVPDSLFDDMEKYPLPPDYDKWKGKIIRHIKTKKFEEAIFLLNHLLMGKIDDSPEEFEEEFETRYCDEFNINPGSTKYNILVIDDFFFLHVYRFSLVERFNARFDEQNNRLLPEIHFNFECNPGSAIKRFEEDLYDLILLDIDFGQQNQNAENVAIKAREKGIPIIMFSKFELADKYDKFQINWNSLPRIKKDLGYNEMYFALLRRLEEVNRIKDNERVHQELKNARLIQQGFLPQESPNIKNLEIWGKNESCYEVSGDYFDFIHLKESDIFIFVIGDVSGKGLPASLIMSGAHTSLHAILQDKPHPEQVVSRLNQIIHKITPTEKFITFFYGEIDLKTMKLHYVNAGHNTPFILSPSGEIQELEKGGLMLGIFPEHVYESDVKKLQKGDILCLYTDGVAEALNPSKDIRDADVNPLKDIIKIKKDCSASEIGEEIFEKLKHSSAYEKGNDDQTMVIVRVNPGKKK